MNKLQPAGFKYSKHHKGGKIKSFKGTAKYNLPKKCEYGLQSLDAKRITAKQIETIYTKCRHYSRKFTNSERILMSIFPHQPFAKKAVGQRMGSGKGAAGFYGINIKKGQIIIEMDAAHHIAMGALEKIKNFLPVRTAIKRKFLSNTGHAKNTKNTPKVTEEKE